MRRFLCIVMTVILMTSMFSACQNVGEKELTKIKIGYHTNYGGSGVVMVGVEKGYFEAQGLDVELVPFTSGPPAIASLNSGMIDFAYVGQGAHSLIINGLADVVCMQNISNSEAIIVNANSGITSLFELKGKAIGCMFGTSSEILVKVALESVGLTEDDVLLVNYDMGGAGLALLNGQVDAICVWEHYIDEAMAKLGNNGVILSRTSAFSESYVSLSSWVATSDYIEKNEDTVQRFVNAVVKAQDYWSYNTEEVCGYINNHLKIPLADLLNSKDDTTILTIRKMNEYIENDFISKLYRRQQEYFLRTDEGVKECPLEDYVKLKFMKEAIKVEW